MNTLTSPLAVEMDTSKCGFSKTGGPYTIDPILSEQMPLKDTQRPLPRHVMFEHENEWFKH
jgi:hypothetical protein